jgi:hypothetical protein
MNNNNFPALSAQSNIKSFMKKKIIIQQYEIKRIPLTA